MEGVNDGFEFPFTEVFVEMNNKPGGFVVGGNKFPDCFTDGTCDAVRIICTETIKAFKDALVIETES